MTLQLCGVALCCLMTKFLLTHESCDTYMYLYVRAVSAKESVLTSISIFEMMKRAGDAVPKRVGATADYSLVSKNFDAVSAARDVGLTWRQIASSIEFEGLASPNPEKILSLYFHTIQRNRIKAATKAALKAASLNPSTAKAAVAIAAEPVFEPASDLPRKALPPLPGEKPRPTAV